MKTKIVIKGRVVFALVFLCVSTGIANAQEGNERFKQVEGWTGNYHVNVQSIQSHESKSSGIFRKELLTINAQVVLGKKTVARNKITWEGRSTCKVSSNVNSTYKVINERTGKEAGVDGRGSDSRTFETSAKLVMHPQNKYYFNVCGKPYKYKVTMESWGDSRSRKSEENYRLSMNSFLGYYNLNPWVAVPDQGYHLVVNYNLTDGPEGQSEAEASKRKNKTKYFLNTGGKVSGTVQWSFSPDINSDGKK